MAFAQESKTIVKVSRVDITDALFYQMLNSVVKDVETCPMTMEISCGIFSWKYDFPDSEYFIFSIKPFDELFMIIESLLGTDSWRTTTIKDFPIMFFFSDSNIFSVTDTSQIIINPKSRVTYEYVVSKDSVDISKQTPKTLYLREEYTKEHGKYLFQYKSPCININDSEKIMKTGNRVIYIIKE